MNKKNNDDLSCQTRTFSDTLSDQFYSGQSNPPNAAMLPQCAIYKIIMSEEINKMCVIFRVISSSETAKTIILDFAVVLKLTTILKAVE